MNNMRTYHSNNEKITQSDSIRMCVWVHRAPLFGNMFTQIYCSILDCLEYLVFTNQDDTQTQSQQIFSSTTWWTPPIPRGGLPWGCPTCLLGTWNDFKLISHKKNKAEMMYDMTKEYFHQLLDGLHLVLVVDVHDHEGVDDVKKSWKNSFAVWNMLRMHKKSMA